MGEQFFDKYSSNVIGINKDFLNEFLADCNAEYLKVFLFLHWKGDNDQTIESIADFLNLTESDVIKALKYWINHKVLNENVLQKLQNKKIDIHENNNIIKINTNYSENDNVLSIRNSFTDIGNYMTSDMGKGNIENIKAEDKIKIEEGVNFLVNQTELLLKNPVTIQHEEFYKKLFIEYKFDKDMILKLIMYCVSLGPGKRSIKYMQAVADSWRQEGVKNIDDIDAIIKVMNKGSVKTSSTNASNIKKKNNPLVDDMMDKWSKKGFGV